GDDGSIVRDPTFPDLPSFAEVCEAAASCETSGPAWDAWVAFFSAGFPAQKMVFLPAGAPQEAIDTYTAAFQAITEREDFAEISVARLGVYPQMTGDAAEAALSTATVVPDEARDFVIGWLSDRYGVVLE
ncbi:MAG: tricarboxylate transporter, partial [Pseudomonadota bacterium]